MGKVNYSFLNKTDAFDVLSKDDDFLRSLNKENLKFYILGEGFTLDPREYSVDDYKAIVKLACRDFPEKKKEKVRFVLDKVNVIWENNGFPDLEVRFIETDGTEAFGLPYTRGNCVILPVNLKNKGSSILDFLNAGLVIHEIFHVLSRAYPEIKTTLYSFFGFEPTSVLDFDGFLINPDAPLYNQKINLLNKDQVPFYGMLNLHIKTKGGVYTSLEWKKILNLQTKKYVKFEDTNLAQIIGPNTQYIIHPEEICAEHFRLVFANQSVEEVNPYSKVAGEIKDQGKLDDFLNKLKQCKF